MGNPKRTTLIVVAIAVLIAGYVFYHLRANKAKTSAAENQPLTAAVTVVRRQPAITSVTLPGVFQAYQDIAVMAKVSGYVKQINVDIGDIVHTGEVLAVLEVPELRAQVAAAESSVTRDKAEIERTRHDVRRAEAVNVALHAEYVRLSGAAATRPGLIAQQELDDAQAKDLSSQAQIDAARSAYDAAVEKLSEDQALLQHYQALFAYTFVRAPFDGVVTFRYADTGALMAAGTGEDKNAMPLVRLAQSGLLRLRMPVPESDADFMYIGGPATVQVQATGELIHTKIVRFTRSMDRNTRTMLTEVDIPNRDLHLAPGMYANTTFPLKAHNEALSVPIDAIVEGDNPYVLEVDNNNRVVKKSIVMGIQGPNRVEIVSGVNEGDRVIVGNQANYQPGQRVTPSPTDMGLVEFKQTVGSQGGAQ
jgi:RND family efflux transporter MFP subunit